MPLHRTQILLEPEQHRALRQIARMEDRSVSDVVRDAVRRELERRRAEGEERSARRLAWLRRAERLRDRIAARRNGEPIAVDPAEMLRQLRDERDDGLVATSAVRRPDGGD